MEAQLIREKEEWEEQKISLNEKVDTARVEEAQALRHLEELSIKAPFTGILTEIRVSPGDTVSLVEPLGVLQSKKHLVEVTLLEEDFQGIEANQSVAISFRSEGTAIFHGKISGYSGASGYFDANGFSDNRRRIFVDMADGNERFAVGSTGEAEIIKAYKRDVVLVPRRALVGENLCIWKNGSIEVRKVKIGIHNLLVAEALDGLELGGLLRLGALRDLVAILAVVHDLTHGGTRLGGDLHQVQTTLACDPAPFIRVHDPELLSFWTDDSHRVKTNLVVHAVPIGGRPSLSSLRFRNSPPGGPTGSLARMSHWQAHRGPPEPRRLRHRWNKSM